MSAHGRVAPLLGGAATLLLIQALFVPLISYQNDQIARNASLAMQLDRAQRRIASIESFRARAQQASSILEEAHKETLIGKPGALIEYQRRVEEVFKSQGTQLQSFEWGLEREVTKRLHARHFNLSISGDLNNIIAGTMALSAAQPLSNIVSLRFRNTVRRGMRTTSGEVTAEIFVNEAEEGASP